MPSSSERRTTAFLSHYDCSRHDTGWGHPDHQGRLPALMRAVHADMLTLFDALLQLDGRHATREELLLAHTASYLERVEGWSEGAHDSGTPAEVEPGLIVSAATWDASLAAVGTSIRGAEAILNGEVENAFCAIRPAARDAGARQPGRYGCLNQLAATIKVLERWDVRRILVVGWGRGDVRLDDIEGGGGAEVRVLDGSRGGPRTHPSDALEAEAPDSRGSKPLVEATLHELESGARGFTPDFVLLSAGFDDLAGDPVGRGDREPGDYFDATRILVEYARAECEGRLLSILEGGYGERVGSAVVNHLRGLADLQPKGI